SRHAIGPFQQHGFPTIDATHIVCRVIAVSASAPSTPPPVKERPMMKAMEREDRPVVEEDCPVVESVTAPAAPHDVLDRRGRLWGERRASGRCDQCLGVIW